jgi:hypothetical protein
MSAEKLIEELRSIVVHDAHDASLGLKPPLHANIFALFDAFAASQEEITRLRKALEWQPIETAPRDGTRFLAAEPEDGWIIGICVWCKTPHVPIYGFHFTDGDPEDWDMCNPKFWRPLTAPTHPHEGDSA